MGYHRAGFEVVGVDIKPQPRFPFEFIQGDAMHFPMNGFDVIHASPPCQAFSCVTPDKSKHEDLLTPIRDKLEATGVTWVIENVIGAPLWFPLMLCGSMFGLEDNGAQLRRHRIFESSHLLMMANRCKCHGKPTATVAGDLRKNDRANGSNSAKMSFRPGVDRAGRLMGIDWMTGSELSQAIPPAYTEWIGKQIMTKK